MRRILVTGGAGFIGSHLHDALRQQGFQVRILDNLSSGSRTNLPDDVDLVVGDVSDPIVVRTALNGMDGCFHLAAVASVALSNSDWVGTHRTNLTGLITLLDAVRDAPIPVVYASSAAVYGDCQTLPITESAPKNPLSAYGADKYGCELHASVATKVHSIPTVGLRFFNVYGPRQDPHSPYSGVISIFCEHIMAGKDITIFGDGEQVRDFIYVDDVVATLMAAMEHVSYLHQAPKLQQSPVINVCTGSATSVNDLASTIIKLTGQQPRVQYAKAREGDIRQSIGDPLCMAVLLGVESSVTLEAGLRRVLTWMQSSNKSTLTPMQSE